MGKSGLYFWFDVESESNHATTDIFDRTEIAEYIYEIIIKPIKKWSESNQSGHSESATGVEATSINKHKKNHIDNHKTINAHHHNGELSSKKSCMIHGPIHSSERFKLLYSYRKT